MPSLRILIVEDHDDSRRIISRVLRDRAHHVTEARAAGEGLAFFGAGEFDLVICDIGLPDYNGDRLIKEIQALKPVKAIALTALSLDSARLDSPESGFSLLLRKPVESGALFSAIERVWNS